MPTHILCPHPSASLPGSVRSSGEVWRAEPCRVLRLETAHSFLHGTHVPNLNAGKCSRFPHCRQRLPGTEDRLTSSPVSCGDCAFPFGALLHSPSHTGCEAGVLRGQLVFALLPGRGSLPRGCLPCAGTEQAPRGAAPGCPCCRPAPGLMPRLVSRSVSARTSFSGPAAPESLLLPLVPGRADSPGSVQTARRLTLSVVCSEGCATFTSTRPHRCSPCASEPFTLTR